MKKSLIITAACLALIFTLSAVPGQAKTFKWSFQGDVQSLDPHSLNETFLVGFLSNVYECLVRRGPNLEIEPALAEKWEILEPTRWRFYLRKGVKFHNGNDFNADDVIFTYHRTLSEGSDYKGRVSTVKEVIKIDDYTVDFVTKQPNPILISEWAAWFIMDKEWSEEHNAAESTDIRSGKENYATRHENGTGPFVVIERQKDVQTVLRPFKGWWDKPKHNLTEVIFKPIGSDATRVAALLSGEIDMIYPVPVQDHKRIDRNNGTSVMVGPELRTIFLGMNQHDDELPCCNIKGKNPLKDKRVRMAFYKAINIDAIKKKIMRGLSEPTAIMISPKLFQYDISDIERPSYDPAAAKNLLVDAGYPNGFTMCMDCPNNRYVNDEQICQAVVAMLAKIGVKVKLTALPKARYFKKVFSYDSEFFMLGSTPSSLDSWNVFFNLVTSRNSETGWGKYNAGNFSNAKVDELTAKIVTETDIKKRNQMIHDVYKIVNEEAGYIPLHQQALAWGKKDNIELAQKADNTLMLYYVNVK